MDHAPGTEHARERMTRLLTLACAPNASRDAARLRGERLSDLSVFNLGGRRVHRLGSGVDERIWDGRDREGRLMPPGLHLARETVAPGRWCDGFGFEARGKLRS